MLTDILRRYQSYNPLTDTFDLLRMHTEYAELLGINYVYLSQIYNGSRKPGMETFSKLMRAFPQAQEQIGKEIGAALAAPQETQRVA